MKLNIRKKWNSKALKKLLLNLFTMMKLMIDSKKNWIKKNRITSFHKVETADCKEFKLAVYQGSASLVALDCLFTYQSTCDSSNKFQQKMNLPEYSN